MTPDGIASLGSAAAAVAVVIIFLRYLAKREADWQAFFTALNIANASELSKLRDSLDMVVKGINVIATDLRTHDDNVTNRIHVIETAAKHTVRRAAEK